MRDYSFDSGVRTCDTIYDGSRAIAHRADSCVPSGALLRCRLLLFFLHSTSQWSMDKKCTRNQPFAQLATLLGSCPACPGAPAFRYFWLPTPDSNTHADSKICVSCQHYCCCYCRVGGIPVRTDTTLGTHRTHGLQFLDHSCFPTLSTHMPQT